jgi:DNA-binding transcriptional MerR regulator
VGQNGLLIGQVAARSGVSRKALRLYEADGIVPAPRRSTSGYRVYDGDVLVLLAFVKRAQRLAFRLDEIKEIVAIRRSGRVPCPHVRDLVRRKLADMERALADLAEVRGGLRALLSRWRSLGRGRAVVCPHIEHSGRIQKGGRRHGAQKALALPRVRLGVLRLRSRATRSASVRRATSSY